MSTDVEFKLSLSSEAIAEALSNLPISDLDTVLRLLAIECVDSPSTKPRAKKLSAYDLSCRRRQAELWSLILDWEDK